MKIPAIKFEVLWSESNVQTKRVFHSWRTIGQHVRRIAQLAPRGGGYDKTMIRVTFADEEIYESRLDIQHYTLPFEVNDNDLARHIRQFLSFHTGNFCPSHMTQEDYQDYINGSGKKARADCQLYLDTYDIPESDGVIVNATVYHCLSCKLPFHSGLFMEADNKLCGRCQHNQEVKDAARAKRDAERVARESDPLWPTYKEGRSAVTKKMRQLLKERSGKTWSVRGGRGTGWGWLEICAPPARMDNWSMTEEDQKELADLLGKDRVHCQGETVPSDSWWRYLKACRGDHEHVPH